MFKPFDVLVTGTFNIVHSDHLLLLQYAQSLGHVTVGINGDEYLHYKYGILANSLETRVNFLRATNIPRRIIVFEEDNPSKLIERLNPDILVKGPDYKNKKLIEQEALDKTGTVVLFRPGGETIHTKDLLNISKKTIVHPKCTKP